MKEQNKTTLVSTIDTIIKSEFEEMTKLNESLKTKITEKDKEIIELKRKVSDTERIQNKYVNYKLFYHLHNSVCPQCGWAGGWQDGYGNGDMCDVCSGTGEIRIEEARKFIHSQICPTIAPSAPTLRF